MNSNNVDLQIRLLMAYGSCLRSLGRFSQTSDERFHLRTFGMFNHWLGAVFFNPANRAKIHLGKDGEGRLAFPLNDPYWSALLLPWQRYEQGVARVLEQVLVPGTAFLDCGANIGYWSVFASTFIPASDIVAVEPVPTTFRLLLANARKNRSFATLQAALFDRDGLTVEVAGRNHATMRIRETNKRRMPHHWACRTISLDTLWQKHIQGRRERTVIKLDIEGAEQKVLNAAGAVLKNNPLLIYEDHGKDLESTTSCFIAEQLGYQLYHWNDETGLGRVSLDDIREIKRDSKVGYNFVACASDAPFCF